MVLLDHHLFFTCGLDYKTGNNSTGPAYRRDQPLQLTWPVLHECGVQQNGDAAEYSGYVKIK